MIRAFFRNTFVTVAMFSFFLADPAYPGWNHEKNAQLFDVTPEVHQQRDQANR